MFSYSGVSLLWYVDTESLESPASVQYSVQSTDNPEAHIPMVVLTISYSTLSVTNTTHVQVKVMLICNAITIIDALREH